MMMDVFPLDTSGSGRPVGGMHPVTTRAFTSTCMPKMKVMPSASRYANTFFVRDAILTPR